MEDMLDIASAKSIRRTSEYAQQQSTFGLNIKSHKSHSFSDYLGNWHDKSSSGDNAKSQLQLYDILLANTYILQSELAKPNVLLAKKSWGIGTEKFRKGIHAKVFKKINALIRHSDEDSEWINDECAYVVTYIGSLLVQLNLLPTSVSKSTEGSVAFGFRAGEDFTSLEVFNDGEIVLLRDKGGKVFVDDMSFNQIEEILLNLQ